MRCHSNVFFGVNSFSTKQFWRTSLRNAVWGDPEGVSDSDVLRYKWPSIGAGWERGLMHFSRAQLLLNSNDDSTLQDDATLFQHVLDLPNTRILVVLGGKDRVIPSKFVRNFFEEYKDRVEIVEMEGLGHDPFEEDTEGFCSVVDDFLANSKERKHEIK